MSLSQESTFIQTLATCIAGSAAMYACINSPLSAFPRFLIPLVTTASAAVASGIAAQFFIDKKEFKDCKEERPTSYVIGAILIASLTPLFSASR